MVSEGLRAGHVGADEVALDHAVAAEDPEPAVAGDHVARPGLGAAHDDTACGGLGITPKTPPLPFPRAFVPVTSVPIRLP